MLLGKRRGSHGAGEYAFPGGHLEYTESFVDCVTREVAEECGISLANVRFQFVANVRTYAPKHYVHIGLIADWVAAEPQVLEPDKCESWGWYDMKTLPEPLFKMARLAVDSSQTGTTYYDI